MSLASACGGISDLCRPFRLDSTMRDFRDFREQRGGDGRYQICLLKSRSSYTTRHISVTLVSDRYPTCRTGKTMAQVYSTRVVWSSSMVPEAGSDSESSWSGSLESIPESYRDKLSSSSAPHVPRTMCSYTTGSTALQSSVAQWCSPVPQIGT